MKNNQIIVATKGKIAFQAEDIQNVTENEILIKTMYSAVSHGTEYATIQGTVPSFKKSWNKKYRIYNSHNGVKKYPCKLGYENIGKIIQVGKNIQTFSIGDIVWSDSPHQEYSIIDPLKVPVYKIPSKSHIKQMLFFVLTRVALAGIHDAQIQIGDRVAVFGLGTVGLITIQLAHIASQQLVFGVDPIGMRQKSAMNLSAIVFNPNSDDPAEKIHKETAGFGVDVAIETSGNTSALHEAIRSCRVGGKVVTVGTYRQSANSVFFGEEWHKNRIELISSMSVNKCPSRNYPRWDLERLNKTALDLLNSKQLRVEQLITHTFKFKDALKAYRLLLSHPEKTTKIIFTY